MSRRDLPLHPAQGDYLPEPTQAQLTLLLRGEATAHANSLKPNRLPLPSLPGVSEAIDRLARLLDR